MNDRLERVDVALAKQLSRSMALNATLNKRTEALKAALDYVADMTFCGPDAMWHFKYGYDPQRVLDALASARAALDKEAR